MARKQSVKSKSEPVEGFQPQRIERVLGEPPSSVQEDMAKKPKTELYLNQKDVPESMRWVLPPIKLTSPAGAPTIQESFVAIEQMLESIRKKRAERAISDAKDPPRMRVARAAVEELEKVKVKATKVESDEQRQEST